MSANNPLVAGVILIVVGVAFALLAYALLLGRKSENRRSDNAEADVPLETEAVSDAPPDKAAPLPVQAAPAAPPVTPPPSPAPPPMLPPASLVTGQSTPPASAPPPAVLGGGLPASPAPPGLAGSRLIPGALLLRDEVTGKLVVQVGSQQYASPAELKASKDWLRVERLASDLASWAVPSTPEKPGPPGREEPAPRPASMIEQINEIFERKLLASGEGRRGIRLTTGLDGGVRVLFGLQPYSLDQVPDPEISRMIRESVAEWEKQG